MAHLYFDPKALPRSMTRQQWREVYRWKRVCEKRLRDEMDKRMRNLMVFGTSHPEMYEREIGLATNPAMVIHPVHWDMFHANEAKVDDLRPGTVFYPA